MTNFDNSNIRRQDRTLDETSATELLQNGEFGILSMLEQRGETPSAYGIPINYVWNGDKYIYFHCAPEGHKLKCLDVCPSTSFTVIGKTKVIPDKFTTRYESIIIRGTVSRNLPESERVNALALLLDKYSPNDKETGMIYAEKSFHRTEIIRFEIESYSGKTKRI